SPLIQNVAKAATSVTLTLPKLADVITAGTPVVFIASVTPANVTGTVVFFDGTTAMSGPVAVDQGIATFVTSSLSVGTHSISAQYGGDANFNASNSAPLRVKVK